jgi:hypothetical protein
VAMSGTGRRRRRGLVGGRSHPWWRRWRTGRRCRGPVGGLVGGDVGDYRRRRRGTGRRDWLGPPVGGDAGDWSAACCRGLAGGPSVAMPGTGRRRRRIRGLAGPPVGGDVGGPGGDAGDCRRTGRWRCRGTPVGGDVGGTGRRGLVTLRWRRVGDRSAAMSGTGRGTGRWRCRGLVARRRGGLVGGLVGPPVGGDAGGPAAMSGTG